MSPRTRNKPGGSGAAKKSGKASTSRTVQGTRALFSCPECGAKFGRAASLGAHRSRAHGVAGTSRPDRGRARKRSTTTVSDRDQLLALLFPTGVPPRVEVIRAVNDWLDEAERLAKVA